MRKRVFLLLQGPQSRFFKILAKELEEKNCRVLKVNFCGGDVLSFISGNVKTHLFNGKRKKWQGYLQQLVDEYAVTDVLLFGDLRPLHRQAVFIAQQQRLKVFVFEEGYLQPDYITVEENGVNGLSELPKTRDDVFALAAVLPEISKKSVIANSISRRVWDTVSHHTGNVLLWWAFPFYRTHRPYCIGYELRGWIPRYFSKKKRSKEALLLQNDILCSGKSFYLFPLQLNSDFQIRCNSPYSSVLESIKEVISSFARAASPETLLVIKNHPLDNGLIDYQSEVASLANSYGVAERVFFLDGGDGLLLMAKSSATVTINSTMGLKGLQLGIPVFCLGSAIYSFPGLAIGSGEMNLDIFWQEKKEVEPKVLAAFIKILHNKALVRGNYYTEEGIKEAVVGVLKRLSL